jgi:hypothetical protein
MAGIPLIGFFAKQEVLFSSSAEDTTFIYYCYSSKCY